MINRVRGFSLVELMVTVAIATILAAIAYPSYTSYVMRTNRVDGTSLLLKIAAAEEKWYLQNNKYTDSGTDLKSVGIASLTSEHGRYVVTVTPADATQFLATATAVGSQSNDVKCAKLAIDQTGKKTALTSGGAANDADCWR